MKRLCIAMAVAAISAGAAAAEGFRTVGVRAAFARLVDGKRLTRGGVNVGVGPRGRIEGRAFGRRVTGAWRWAGGYFCPAVRYGGEALRPDCLAVMVRGDTLRFVADRGAGQYADLNLR